MDKFFKKIIRSIKVAVITFTTLWLAVAIFPLDALVRIVTNKTNKELIGKPKSKPMDVEAGNWFAALVGGSLFALSFLLNPFNKIFAVYVGAGLVIDVIGRIVRRKKTSVEEPIVDVSEDPLAGVPEDLKREIVERNAPDLVDPLKDQEVKQEASEQSAETKPDYSKVKGPQVSRVRDPGESFDVKGNPLPQA